MENARKTILFSVILIIVLIISAFVTSHVTRNLLDEDASADLLLANCFYEEKTLLPDDWFFGNEYRIFGQLIWAPFFGVFENWGTVRLCGTLTIQLLFLLSFIFMMRSAFLKTNTILLGCVLLLIPYCVSYGRIVLYHNYYTLYITFSFLILGFVFRLSRNFPKTGSKPICILQWILFAVTCFFSGLSGIRELYIFLGPFCALVFWQLIIFRRKRFLFSALFSFEIGRAHV